MMEALGRTRLEALDLLDRARSLLESGEPDQALRALQALDAALAASRGLAARGEPLMRALVAGIRREEADSADGAQPGPRQSLHMAADRLILAQAAQGGLEARARALRALALEGLALRALADGPGAKSLALWREALFLSPLSPPLLEAGRRFGLSRPPGCPALSAGPVFPGGFQEGLSAILPWKGGLLAATRRRNAQGLFLDVAIERVGPGGQRAPVALERPVDLRPLEGGVNPFFSMAAHPGGEEVVFPEFVSQDRVGLSALHVESGRIRPFGAPLLPAASYPFNLASDGERIWRICLFSGTIEELDAHANPVAALGSAPGMLAPHAVLPLEGGDRLIACKPALTRRKYGRFLDCASPCGPALWRWNPAAGEARPLDPAPALPGPPRFVFSWLGRFVFCCDHTVEVRGPGFEPLLSLDLRAYAATALGKEARTDIGASFLCCMDGPRLHFAEPNAVDCLGFVTFEPGEGGQR